MVRVPVSENGVTKKHFTSEEIYDKVKAKPNELPSKRFEARNSLLTDLYEIPHVRTIYRIIIVSIFGYFINTVAYDYLIKGEIKLGFSLIRKGFANFHLLIVIWLGMFLSTFLVYYGFKLWTHVRIQLTPKSPTIKLWDKICLTLFVLFYPTFLYFSTLASVTNGQPIAASMGLLLEMTRLLMKCHAFVRSNAPKVLNYKPHSDSNFPCPDLSKFLYFFFAPTLIYQDEYPRTKTIRWNYVAACFAEFFGAIFFESILVERFFIPFFEDYGKVPKRWQDIVVIVSGNFIPSMLIMLNIFYIVLHAWLNAFAEMLTFADRLFYKDWWTSSDYGRYYRTWNVVVHDWLYQYVYKDFYEIVTPKNKVASKLMVFFLSAVFHDYVLGFAFGFCLPILFVNFFGFGVLLNFFKSKGALGNLMLWYFNAIGMSINCAFYCMELYSRYNCPIENPTVSSYFIPRMFSCYK